MNRYSMEVIDTTQEAAAIESRGAVWKDFGLVIAGAVALLGLVILGQNIPAIHPLRIILGLAYVLLVPGYCLTTALFPRPDDLDSIERTGLSIGLSIAIISILALVLDWLPWGLHLWPILLGEYSVIALCMAVSVWRRSQLPRAEAYPPSGTWQPRTGRKSLSVSERRIYKLLAAAMLLFSILAIWVFLVPSPDEYMTEFYILGPNGVAENYPYQVELQDEVSVTLGIANREQRETSYRVEVWVEDPSNPGRRSLVHQSGPFRLKPSEVNQGTLSWHMPWAGDDQKVELLLFSNNELKPSHLLRMWVNVREKFVLQS
jgi:uncharacterized membrane protein